MRFLGGIAGLLFACLAFACGDDGGTTEGGGGSGGQPVSDLTELTCPNPGLLPFVTETQGFASADNEVTAESNPRSKDEASDTLGVPGGVRTNTYAAVTDSAEPGDPVYDGRKARTSNASGLSTFPLPGEAVSLWYYDPAASSWSTFGRADTDGNGSYSIDGGTPTERGRPVYSILEADGSCAEHYDYIMPEGTKIIVSDVDGTLTTDDAELLQQINDVDYVPAMKGSANALLQAWADKGYIVIYLSARAHYFRSETRVWLRDEGFPTGPLLTANALVFDDTARTHKASWLNRIVAELGWDIVAVYGNAESDIQAYEDAGISKDITFIIGEFAGTSGTQAIENDDYASHIETYVSEQPDLGEQP